LLKLAVYPQLELLLHVKRSFLFSTSHKKMSSDKSKDIYKK